MALTKCPYCTYAAEGDAWLPGHLSMLAGKLGHPAVEACRPDDFPPYEPPAPKPEPKPKKSWRKASQQLIAEGADQDDAAITLRGSRESWLLEAVEELRPLFIEAGHPIPEKVRVSVGWPGGRGKKKGVTGQCWQPESSEDKVPAIFISPVQKDPLDVLETLTHELVHASGQWQHRANAFGKVASKVGLTAPWPSTRLSDAHRERCEAIAKKLGAYDHARLRAGERQQVQSTRMLKVVCIGCGCVIRMTRKWLNEAGAPTCACGVEMEEEAA